VDDASDLRANEAAIGFDRHELSEARILPLSYAVGTKENHAERSRIGFDYSDRVSATTLSGPAAGGASGSLSAPSKIVKRSLRGRPIVAGKAPMKR
jgi:hypothetical protein